MNFILFKIIIAFFIWALFYVGPLNSVNLELNGLKENYSQEKSIDLIAKIQINQNQRIMFQNISLKLNDLYCTFTIEGEKLTYCPDINLTLISNLSRGFGYGYITFKGESEGNYSGLEKGFGEGYGRIKSSEIIYKLRISPYTNYLFNEYEGQNKLQFIAETNQQVLTSKEHITLIDLINETGEFLMISDDGEMTFVGNYTTIHENWLDGKLLLNSSNKETKIVGSYIPYSHNSGSILISVLEPEELNDNWHHWAGNYSEGRWTLWDQDKHWRSVSGKMIKAPW
jgi:hypothetical protein